MAEYSAKADSFSGHDGVNLFYRQYPAPNERARLVIAHGLGEHAGRYGIVVDRLLPRDISIWALDHRGHGKSGGKRPIKCLSYLLLDDLRDHGIL